MLVPNFSYYRDLCLLTLKITHNYNDFSANVKRFSEFLFNLSVFESLAIPFAPGNNLLFQSNTKHLALFAGSSVYPDVADVQIFGPVFLAHGYRHHGRRRPDQQPV